MKLNEILKDAFLYKWEKNGFVYYIGSSHRTYNKRDLTIGGLLDDSEKWHRKLGIEEGFRDDAAKYAKARKNGGEYDYTFFRSQIQNGFEEFFKDTRPVFLTEPVDMTRQELLTLEGEAIRKMVEIGQCVWNVDCNPLETYIRNAKKRRN
jgi:hypothetical protein